MAPCGRVMYTCSQDGTLKAWDTSGSAAAVRTFKGHESYVAAVAISDDGASLHSLSDDGTLRVWNTATGAEDTCIPTTTGAAPGAGGADPHVLLVLGHVPVASLAFWPTATQSASAGGTVALDRSGGRKLGVQLVKGSGGLGAVVKSVDKGGQAEGHAAVRPGAAITHINGQAVGRLGMAAIRAIITSQERTELVLEGQGI